MANLDAGGMKSLAQCVEAPEANNSVIVAEWNRVCDLSMKTMEKPIVVPDEQPTTAQLGDAPLFQFHGSPSSTKHLIDALVDWEGTVNKARVKTLIPQGRYAELPEPLKPKTAWEKQYTMQLHAVETSANKWTIVKYFRFADKVKTSAAVENLCSGNALVPHWVDHNPHMTKKVVRAGGGACGKAGK